MSFQIAKYFKAQSQLFHCKAFSQISRFGVSVLPLVIFRETLSPRPASIHSLLVSNSCAVGVSLPVNPYKTCHLIRPPQPQLLRSSPWSIFFFAVVGNSTMVCDVYCSHPTSLVTCASCIKTGPPDNTPGPSPCPDDTLSFGSGERVTHFSQVFFADPLPVWWF